MSGISTSKHDGSNRNKIYLLLETSKKLDKIYKTTVLKTSGIKGR